MTKRIFGTLAALEFAHPPRHGFEDIVEEVDISFQPVGLTRRSLIKDGDDIAIVERDNLRVLLGWLPPANDTGTCFLLLAVGPSPDCSDFHVSAETCCFVKDVLLEHLQSYLSFDTVFHADATQPVTTELLDIVSDILQDGDHANWVHSPLQNAPPRQPFASRQDEPHDIWSTFGRTRPDRPRTTPVPVPPLPECSLPKRLTIYTLGATMLLYTPPVGASLLVYSTLRDVLSSDPLPA